MMGFILFTIAALSVSIVAMIHMKKSIREIGLFVVIVVLGMADWISIFLDRTFNPNRFIASLIDWIGG